jgi:hypothetical protein
MGYVNVYNSFDVLGCAVTVVLVHVIILEFYELCNL